MHEPISEPEPTNTGGGAEPLVTVASVCGRITLLGTAHVSRASAEKVKELIATETFDAVAVELCPSRHDVIVNPDALARMDLLQVLRERKGAMVAANLALGAYQQRMAEQLDIMPGAEMRAAIAAAREARLPLLLIDREISVTLKRIYRGIPWWKRLHLGAALIAGVLLHKPVTPEEIERLKEGDILEAAFTHFAEQARELYVPLIEERDRYMSARLEEELAGAAYRNILAVVGAGHLRGMQRHLAARGEQCSAAAARAAIAALDRIPPASRWPRLVPWVIVALIIGGFVVGFQRSPEIGWHMVYLWVTINGGLAALGALIAAAHPLTVVGAFAAAPLTSLNPMIGAGMVTAAIEIYLRRPSVGDFAQLRRETARLRGWWRNRVARVLLVFLFCTFGSALGTYLAGFLIFERLMAG